MHILSYSLKLEISKSKQDLVVNLHQRFGYSDLPFARKDTFLYCRVQKGAGGGGQRGYTLTKRTLSLGKRYFFVMEKHIEDVKQDQKTVPDLVESIMRPTDPAKEELRRILFKMSRYRPQIIKIRVSTFWMSGKNPDFRRRLPAGAKQFDFDPFLIRIHPITAPKTSKMRVLACEGHLH